jgi:hypothetical protein
MAPPKALTRAQAGTMLFMKKTATRRIWIGLCYQSCCCSPTHNCTKKQKRKKVRRQKKAIVADSGGSEGSDSGDSSSDDEDGSEGKDLIGSYFEDEGVRCKVTAFGEHKGNRTLPAFYDLPTDEEVFSQVSEARGWVKKCANLPKD